MLWWLADDECHPGVSDEFADHHAAGDLAGDEQAARGLRVGEKQSLALLDSAAPPRVRRDPVQVAARAAADIAVAHRLPGTVEVLNGRFIYAIKVHITGETFDLCPADICRTTSGVELNRAACAIDAPKSGIRVEGYEPPREVIADVERIMQHAGIEIGGVEYITDDRDGQRLYYDINALSNFVADGKNVIGFDPFTKLADWLEAEAAKAARVPELTHG